MANIITACRVILSLILIGCPVFSDLFYWLYVIAGISDAIDGSIARLMNQETEFGSKFDTFADFLFTSVVLIKVLLVVYVPRWLIIWCILIAVIKAINAIIGIVRRGRFVTAHTLMNKMCGIMLFAIPLCMEILSQQLIDVLVVLTCVFASVAAVQEGRYISASGMEEDVDL